MVDEDFDGFQARLLEATTARQWRGIVDLAIAAITGWSATACRDWVGRLDAGFQLDIATGIDWSDVSTGSDFKFEAEMALVEALLARLCELDEPNPIRATSELLVEATCMPILIDLPRRYLIPLYREWMHGEFIQGSFLYHTQFARKATAHEKVEVAKLATTLEHEVAREMRPILVADALPHLLHLAPELLPRWLDLLEGSTDQMEDPHLVALCARYRALWNRLPLGADLPTALRDYLAAGELHRALVADAKAAVDAVPDDVVRLPKQSLGMLLERDMLLLMAQLPVELELVGCDEAKALLRDYRRLRALGASAPLNLCLLLTRAIEAQLHHALTFGHDGDVRRRIEGAGLATLAEFAMGPVDRLAGLAVRPRLEKADWEVLNHAGRIRNRVHHEPSRVCGADLDHLHRAVFDVDPRAPRLLKKLAGLRCVRMT